MDSLVPGYAATAACAGTVQKIRDRVPFPGANPGLHTWPCNRF